MADRWLLIVDDRVENLIIWDGDLDIWTPPEGAEMIACADLSGVDSGWTRVAGIWGPPAPPVDE